MTVRKYELQVLRAAGTMANPVALAADVPVGWRA